MATEEQKQKKSRKPRYVILKSGKLWESDDGSLHLDRFDPENAYIQESAVPKNAQQDVLEAIQKGTLGVTTEPETYHERMDVVSENTLKRPRFVWTDMDDEQVKNNKRVPRDPSFSNHNITVSNVDKEAVQFLAKRNNTEVKKQLPTFVATMDEERAIQFLQELHYLEIKGFNLPKAPRDGVVALIEKMLSAKGHSQKTIHMSKILTTESEGEESQLLIP